LGELELLDLAAGLTLDSINDQDHVIHLSVGTARHCRSGRGTGRHEIQ
jgi:hypothetical protein